MLRGRQETFTIRTVSGGYADEMTGETLGGSTTAERSVTATWTEIAPLSRTYQRAGSGGSQQVAGDAAVLWLDRDNEKNPVDWEALKASSAVVRRDGRDYQVVGVQNWPHKGWTIVTLALRQGAAA